jgi:hypothetical protein
LWDSRGSLTGTKVGDTHEPIQDVQIELVGGCFLIVGTLAAGIATGTYWQALFVNYLLALIIIAGLFGVLRIRVGEAINTSRASVDM